MPTGVSLAPYRNRIAALVAQGATQREIAAQLGVNRGSVACFCHRNGIKAKYGSGPHTKPRYKLATGTVVVEREEPDEVTCRFVGTEERITLRRRYFAAHARAL